MTITSVIQDQKRKRQKGKYKNIFSHTQIISSGDEEDKLREVLLKTSQASLS